MGEGLRFIWNRPVLLGLMSLDLLSVLAGGVTALLPIFAKDILGVGPVGLGILKAAPAVGALLMGVVLARHPITRAAGRLVFVGIAFYGISTVAFGLSETMILSVIAMLGIGAGDMLGQVLRQTIIQLRIPDTMRGRVAAVSGLSVNIGGQFGQFRAGAMAAVVGAVPAVLIGGVVVLGVVGVWMWRFPDLRRIEKPEPEPEPEALNPQPGQAGRSGMVT